MISSILNENIDTDIANPIVTNTDNVHTSLHPKTRNKLKKGSIHGASSQRQGPSATSGLGTPHIVRMYMGLMEIILIKKGSYRELMEKRGSYNELMEIILI